MSVEFVDVLNACPEDTIPGIKSILHYAPKCDIQTIPELPLNPTNDTEMVTITDNIVMKTGKYFHKIEIQINPATAEVKNTLQGVPGSKSFKGELPFVIVGNSITKEAFARKMKNFEGILYLEEAGGIIRQFGTKGFPAGVESIEGSTGADPAKDGYQDTYKLLSPVNIGKVPRYTGDIPLEPESESSST